VSTATALRDEGIARVERGSPKWTHEARERARTLLARPWEGLGEDLRLALLYQGLPQPHHPNCWGALIKWCVVNGLLVATGDVLNTNDAPSHASYTKVYRSPIA
jgi:hypothetical protein